jgi:signal transduction histidine kinase
MEKKIDNTLFFEMAAMLMFVALIMLFILFYRNRKKQFMHEKQLITEAQQRELLYAKIEVQEQTLQHFCSELHDDIGQKLSVARIFINKLELSKKDPFEKEELTGISQILGEAISDLRIAVNTLSPDAISRFGFSESLNNELKRINKSGLVKCRLQITGDEHDTFTPQQELLLFRICQEFIQNSLKHSHCTEINIGINFEQNPFSMKLNDNGTGFDVQENNIHEKGNGIRNMINRAKILGGILNMESQPETGTTLLLSLTLNITPHAQ